MKISYIHGPGDAFGTFLKWRAGSVDDSIIKQTYSGQFFDVVSGLEAEGQVICVTPTDESMDDRFRFDTVMRQKATGLGHYMAEWQYARAVAAKVKDFGPDILIISSDFPSYAFDALPKRPHKILSIHNTFWMPYGSPQGFKERFENFARKISLRKTAFAVCVSPECQRQFRALKQSSDITTRVQVPRLVERFSGIEQEVPHRILFVGRIEINKGVLDLIRAFHLSKKEFSRITLNIVGDGGALGQAKQLVEQLGIGDSVDFAGHLGAAGVSQAYSQAHICICATQWQFNEGLATVPLEAAAHGVPTIMSQAVPARELFGTDAVTFDPGNHHDLAHKLQVLLSDPVSYRNATRDARESFSHAMREIGDWRQAVSSLLEEISCRD